MALFEFARLGSQPEFAGTPIKPMRAPPLALESDDGKPFTLQALQGRAVLVYFGYTGCPDVCPTTLASLAPVVDRLRIEARRVSVVFVTLDPTHDTPAILRAYLANFRPRPIGLTGTQAAIAAAARAWGIEWLRHPDGPIDHTSVLTLVGPDGNLRVRYGITQLDDPGGMARDIRHVLDAR